MASNKTNLSESGIRREQDARLKVGPEGREKRGCVRPNTAQDERRYGQGSSVSGRKDPRLQGGVQGR
jgi:hypothetical protein